MLAFFSIRNDADFFYLKFVVKQKNGFKLKTQSVYISELDKMSLHFI